MLDKVQEGEMGLWCDPRREIGEGLAVLGLMDKLLKPYGVQPIFRFWVRICNILNMTPMYLNAYERSSDFGLSRFNPL
jgi:hypothetical protein